LITFAEINYGTRKKNIIKTAAEYFSKIRDCDIDDIPVDWVEIGDKNLIQMSEFNLVGEIISAQVPFRCLRRINNSCGSNCDYMMKIIKKKISKYEKKFGEFKGFNLGSIW